MLPIIDKISPVNPFSRPGIKLKHGVRGIVMHYTDSPGAPAHNIDRYFDSLANQNSKDNKVDRYAGAHFSVDDFSIIQSIPELEMAYHCGSKTYTNEANERFKSFGRYPNNCTIGIEMCIDKAGKITEKTFENCVDLVAYLLKKYNLTVNDIWTHKGIVGWKDCPLPWVKNPDEFERFKREVTYRIRPREESKMDTVKAAKVKDDITGHWAEKQIKKVLSEGKMKGFSDGTFRPDEPITRAQMATLIAEGKI